VPVLTRPQNPRSAVQGMEGAQRYAARVVQEVRMRLRVAAPDADCRSKGREVVHTVGPRRHVGGAGQAGQLIANNRCRYPNRIMGAAGRVHEYGLIGGFTEEGDGIISTGQPAQSAVA
jgi:hypothetical protein